MNSKNWVLYGWVAGLTLPAALAQNAESPAGSKVTYFEEAKITINERARADGFMRVRIVPESGAPREATIDVEKRMSENDLARAIADALNAVLGPEYKADKDAGEHVKIRKEGRAQANFSVEITYNVPGFALILDN